MGRVKLKIKKLESTSNRHVTYSKRKSGILKKAKELSILCDIDILLLMFSPTEKPTLLQGERSNMEEIISKFAQLSPQERAKRKMESLEALKKTFKKLDHDVKIQDFLGSSSQTMEELSHQVRVLQAQLAETQQRLSYWSNLEKINNLEHLRQMEDSLRESVNRLCIQKENLRKRQLMSLDCANQLPEGMTLPLMMAGLQESQPLSWLLSGDNHQLMLPNEPKFMPFSDNGNRDVECSTDISLPGYSGYIGNGKLEVGSSPHVNTLGQGGSSLNELNGNPNPYLNVQQCDQFAYPPPQDLEEVKHHQTMNSKSNTMDYQVNNNYELPRSLFENEHQQFWNSTNGSCGIAMYNENGYHR
ncbi:agamous-like MADS-box protein AGL65 isoform X1 [Trifolium pratense]|uniref:agamous-like MADS-box protein AGL65 isoform X1 n=1 Tax=Trifolium pratense TaxID=57577 RepID=UPI001E6934AD|nr:agamous-like MADS-box protein AGL65 isoform X1 [Trifolium pratense]XP_045792793.1 agamous-like MADS-box protein AGL65 isoform X1 [Trifolium pratense]